MRVECTVSIHTELLCPGLHLVWHISELSSPCLRADGLEGRGNIWNWIFWRTGSSTLPVPLAFRLVIYGVVIVEGDLIAHGGIVVA